MGNIDRKVHRLPFLLLLAITKYLTYPSLFSLKQFLGKSTLFGNFWRNNVNKKHQEQMLNASVFYTHHHDPVSLQMHSIVHSACTHTYTEKGNGEYSPGIIKCCSRIGLLQNSR